MGQNTPEQETPGQSAPKNDEKDEKKEEKYQCMACSSVLRSDHAGVICVQNHHICTTEGCAGNFVTHIISEGILGIPVKCMDCNMEVIPNTFERNCTEIQLATYHEMCVWAGSQDEGESLYTCTKCDVMVINIDSVGEVFFECPHCKACYCLTCNECCNNASQREPHVLECPLLGELKTAVEKVICDGGSQSCPACGLSGRKDGNCTHITCPKCRTRWCYVCALERNRAHGGEASHNSGWETDARRCPMYLQYIHRVNPQWPEDPTAAVDRFHERHILWRLHELLVDVGERESPLMPKVWGFLWRSPVTEAVKLENGVPIMQRLLRKFPRIIDGFTIEQIVSALPPRDY